MTILLPILQNIRCDGNYCVNGRVEDTLLAIEELKENEELVG